MPHPDAAILQCQEQGFCRLTLFYRESPHFPRPMLSTTDYHGVFASVLSD